MPATRLGLFRLKKSVCVSFIGIDGSGKTCHAVDLSKSLANMRINSLYIRPEHFITKCLPQVFLNWMSLHVFTRSRKKFDRLIEVEGYQTKDIGLNILNFPSTIIFLIYVWFAYILIVKSRFRRRVLIFDRYFYDWIFYVDKKRSTLLSQFVPRPDLVFLLDVGICEAFSRMHSKKDREFSKDYYLFLRDWYFTLAKQYGFTVISTIGEFNRTKQTILEHTMTVLNMRSLLVS